MRSGKAAPFAGLCVAVLLACCACHPSETSEGERPHPENREAITDFATLYQDNCSGCHGDNGRDGPARILNDKLYLSVIPRQTLKEVINYGRPGTSMPAWAKSQGGPLTDQQIEALVDGIYSNWGGTTAPAGAPSYAASNAGDANHGKQLFLRDCYACHFSGGKPGPITTAAYLELASNQMIRTSVIVGRSDLGMPSYQFLNMGRALSEEDITDLVAYVNSLRTRPAPGEGNASTTGHVNDNGTGHQERMAKGNEGSSNGPGSPNQRNQEGNKGKGKGSSSQRGVK